MLIILKSVDKIHTNKFLNDIPEKRVFGNIMFSSAKQPPRRRLPSLRHNFVVSAITFEGFKLRSSNLTHALLIQISRTSLIIDIGGHFVNFYFR